MAYIDDLKNDINDVSTLLAKRRDSESLRAALLESLTSRISKLSSMSMQEAVELTDLVEEKFTNDTVKNAVQGAIDKRAAAAAKQPGEDDGEADGKQTLLYLYKYLTASDWAIIEDRRASENKKVHTLVHRLQLLGITEPGHEQCLKWLVVVLLHVEYENASTWPSYQSIYNTFRDVVVYMKATKAPFEKSRLEDYPEHPSSLPACLFERAYDKDDPPIEKYLPRYIGLGKHVPMRSSSHLLRSEKWGIWDGPCQSQWAAQGSAQDVYNHYAQQCSAIHAGGGLHNHRKPHVPAICFKPKSPDDKGAPAGSPAVPVATDLGQGVPSPPTVSPKLDSPVPAPEGEPTQRERVDQEQFEDAAFNALKGMAAKKKPAICKKPAGPPPVAKKPAGSPSVAKKPTFDATCTALKITFDPADRQVTRNCFASRWYGFAKAWAKSKKYSDKKISDFAKKTYRDAGDVWRKHRQA